MGEMENRFWELLEPEYRRAMMFCRKLMGDRDCGDDLFQDALVTAYTGFVDLKNAGSFRPWFYRILINTFKSTIRRPWWKRRLSLTPEMKRHLAGDNPVDVYTARRWLQRAFEAVSAEQQTLVTLHDLEGWSVGDLARLYKTSEGSIKARLFRSRRKMKNALVKFSRHAALSAVASTPVRKGCTCDAVKPNID